MTDKNPNGIAMDHMSVAGHTEMLRKSLSPAGHADAFKPVQQPPAPAPAQNSSAAQASKPK